MRLPRLRVRARWQHGRGRPVDAVGSGAPPLYARTTGTTGNYDRFHATEFHVPNYHVLDSGITPAGRPEKRVT